MKKYRLCSPMERFTGLLVSLACVACMVLLVVALRGDVLMMVICGAAGLLVAAGLTFYIVNLFRTACVPDVEQGKMLVRGLPDWSFDLTGTVSLETAEFKNGPMATRTLVFRDEAGEVTASVPTFFTANQGAQAEPLAMELAKALELSFLPKLEPWEYDKEKRKEHEKELARAKKEERRAKIRALKAKLLRKAGAETRTGAVPEEDMSMMDEEVYAGSDGVNYDALDDEK